MWPCKDVMTVAFVATVISQTTSSIVARHPHTRINFTTRTIVSRRANTASISSLINACSTIVTTPLCTVVYWGLTMTTCKRQIILIRTLYILAGTSNEVSTSLVENVSVLWYVTTPFISTGFSQNYRQKHFGFINLLTFVKFCHNILL